MSPDLGTIIGAILGGFVIVIITHKGDIKKVIDTDIEKRLKGAISSSLPQQVIDPNMAGGAGIIGTLSQSQQVNIQLILDAIAGLRRDIENVRGELNKLRVDFEAFRSSHTPKP